MIQMRWLVYEEEETPSTGVYGFWLGKSVTTTKVKKKVLQYRQQLDTTVYAGMGPFPTAFKNVQWTDWIDVPEFEMESE